MSTNYETAAAALRVVPQTNGAGEPATRREFDYTDLGGWMKGDLEPPAVWHEFVVDGKINWLAGHPGRGKTTLALHAAVEHMKTGGHVVWLDWENGEREVAAKLIAVGGKTDTVSEQFHYVAYPPMDASDDGFVPLEHAIDQWGDYKRVLPALGHKRLREVTTHDVQRLMDRLVRDGLAPATIDSALTPMRSLYRHAVSRDLAATNPTRGVEKPAVRPKQKRIVPPDEAAAMLDALPADDRALWATAFYAGLRYGELVALRWEDVDLATGVIHVRRGWDPVEGEIAPKSRRGIRDVPIPAALRDFLVEHRLDGDAGRVFPPARQVRTRAEAAAKLWHEARLTPLTLHEARHTYASLMIAAGVNAKALSTFMGHSNIGITLDLYGHLMPGSEAEAADLLDAYLAREAGGSTVEAEATAA